MDNFAVAKHTSYSIGESIEQLEDIQRRQLRGHDPDPSSTISETMKNLEYGYENLKEISKQIENGDADSSSLTPLIPDEQVMAKIFGVAIILISLPKTRMNCRKAF